MKNMIGRDLVLRGHGGDASPTRKMKDFRPRP